MAPRKIPDLINARYSKTKMIKDGSRPAMKPGPKPKPISERDYVPPDPTKRRERSYTKERRVEVLMYLEHHRVERFDPCTGKNYMRPPTLRDAAEWWKVPQSTVGNWVRNKDKIVASKGKSRKAAKSQSTKAKAPPPESTPGQTALGSHPPWAIISAAPPPGQPRVLQLVGPGPTGSPITHAEASIPNSAFDS